MSTMTLQELIQDSARVHSKRKEAGQYSMAKALSKDFGTVYYNDKVILYDEASNIIEIRMMMGTLTEKAYTGVHAVRIAIYGVKGTVYNSLADLYAAEVGGVDKRTKTFKNAIKDLESVGEIDTTKGILNQSGNLYEKPEILDIERPGQLNDRLGGFIIPVANTDTASFGHSFGSNGKFFYSKDSISLNTPVRVSCSCSNYYYVFGWYNYEHGVHLGVKPTPYKKYAKKGRKPQPVQNVTKTPGMCKHLMLFSTLLLNGGILQSVELHNVLNLNEVAVAKQNIEHLTIPKKLISEPEIERLMTKMSKDLKKVREERNKLIDLDKGYIEGYDQFQKSVSRANYLSGTPIRKGTSKAAYMNSFMSKNASKKIQKVYEYIQKEDTKRIHKINETRRKQESNKPWSPNSDYIQGFSTASENKAKTRISRAQWKEIFRDLVSSGSKPEEARQFMNDYIIED